MSVRRKPVPHRMTLDEFLSWDSGDRTGRRWQLVDGEPMAMAPGSEAHGAIQGELGRLLGNHLLDHCPACRVITEPGIVPRIRANRNYRVPVLGVTCVPPSTNQMVTDPVLLIEILSPSNELETRANIWAYTTLPGLQEIMAVQSTRIEAALLRRGPDGCWPAEPEMIAAGGTLTLASIGYTLPLTAL
jgi:Uma2 family endonuclease